MKNCPKCKNVNVVKEKDYQWCLSCGWSSDGKELPQLRKDR